MRHIILYICIFLFLSNAHAFAANDDQKTHKGFKLFTNCEPIHFVVEELSRHASKIGLTKKSIQNAIESRLRSARLYSNEVLNSYIYVNVTVSGRAFGIGLDFEKVVFDSYSREKNFATTWHDGGIGAHGGSSEYILSNLSQYMDKFLTEFLRVNEEACRKKK